MEGREVPVFDSAMSTRAAPPITTTGLRSNGVANKLSPQDSPVHSWYRFVLSFPPHLVRDYLTRFNAGPSSIVLDPFCGTGTTLVEAKKLGIASVGIEAHPMAHFAAVTKTNWEPDPEHLTNHARQVAAYTRTLLDQDGLGDFPLHGNGHGSRQLLALPAQADALLLGESISPLPLHKTLRLVSALRHLNDPALSFHENLALANALVFSISNLHFGPEVGVRDIKSDAPVVAPWMQAVRNIASHLAQYGRLAEVPSTVLLGDAREVDQLLDPGTIDIVFTSPPYPNEKDYTRTTRLETVLLGFLSNKPELRELKQTLVRSNTRNVYKSDHDDEWIASFPEIAEIAERIETRRLQLGKTSGFERLYHRVALLYFGGMARHLDSLRSCLRPGAHLGYVVGDQASYLRVKIPTGVLLARLAQSLGYELISIDLFRTRLATATREQLREEVVVLKWPG